MVTTQKSTAPVASPNAKSNSPAARALAPVAAAHPKAPAAAAHATTPVAAAHPTTPAATAHATTPVAAAHSTPAAGGPEATCFVHRLEVALQLVESLQLTTEQKSKISALTQAQTTRCQEEKKQHTATHEQILALLTSDQHQTLQAADDAAHCHPDVAATHAEHLMHG